MLSVHFAGYKAFAFLQFHQWYLYNFMLNLHTAINTIRCRPVRDIGPVKAVWCSAQCSGGGCPDETWLLAVLSWTKQHLQQPITESCTVPRRSKPQGQGMPAKLLFHAYLHKCNRCTWMFYFWGKYCCVLFFFHSEICLWLPQTFCRMLRFFLKSLSPLVILAEANLLHHLVPLWYTAAKGNKSRKKKQHQGFFSEGEHVFSGLEQIKIHPL